MAQRRKSAFTMAILVVQRGEIAVYVGNSCGAKGETAERTVTGRILVVQRGKNGVHRWDSCSAKKL